MNKIARVLLGFAAAVLTFTVAAVVQAGDDPPAAPGSGMRVYLDEQGRPIAPPPEAPAVEPPPPQLPARKAPRPVLERAPGGGEMIRNDHVDYSRHHLGKDGRGTVDCVPGRAGTGAADK